MRSALAQLGKSGTWRRGDAGRTGPRRIVVAEDDREMRRLITSALANDGYVVEEALNGTQLLMLVVEGNPAVDLVVSDHRMPVSSGLQVLAGLRDGGWALPFILLSAFGDEHLRSDAANLDAIFLAKPFELDALRIIVRAALIDS